MAKTKVKMLQHLAGPVTANDLEPGKTYELEQAYAQRLIDREFAEAVVPEKKPPREKAVAQTRETATAP